MAVELPEGFVLDDEPDYALPQGFQLDPEPEPKSGLDSFNEGLQGVAEFLESSIGGIGAGVARGATSEGTMMAAEGIYRAAGDTVAPFDRAQYLNQEIQSAQKQLQDIQGNEMMIPEAREAGIAGQQERINTAQQELRAIQTEGTPEFQQQQEIQQSIPAKIGQTLQGVANEAGSLRQTVREAIPIDPVFQASIPGQVAQGLGQLINIPAYAVPGVGQAVSIGQLYQEGYDDALQNGATPEQATEAARIYTAASAPFDILTDKLIVGRAIKGLIGKGTIKDAIKEIGSIAAKEGAAEGIQQLALNAVAKELVGYDPDRPITQDVIQNVLVGAIVGGIGAGGAQVAGTASRPQAEADVASTVIAENAAAQSEVLLNNNAPLTAQAVTENAMQAVDQIINRPSLISKTRKIVSEYNDSKPELIGDERFAPPVANVIQKAASDALNLYSEDPDQAGQSSLKDWRATLPPEIASNVQAHGAPITELQAILEQGIDPERPFYTAPLNDTAGDGLGLRDIGTGGQVLVLGAPGQQIKDSGVQAVVVNDYLAPNVSQLQEAYPNITWLTTKNATKWLNEQQPTRLDESVTIPEGQAQAPETGVAPEVQESPPPQTQGEVNALQIQSPSESLLRPESAQPQQQVGLQGVQQGNQLQKAPQEGEVQVNEAARTDGGSIPETVQPDVPALPEEPSVPASQGPQLQRVQIGSSPQTYQVIGELPQTPIEREMGEQYYQIRNERTGEEQVVERKDMRGVRGANLGPGAANIEEPVVSYEERAFGQRLDADESLDPTLRENIGDKFYAPIPNNVTAEQAREIIAERGIDDSIATIKDESNGLPFHVRSVIGQTLIKNLNQQYTALKESNPQEAQRILQQTVDLAEWQQDYGTRLGQGVQSFAMWQRLTPEGMLASYQRGVRKSRERYEQINPGEVDQIITQINQAVPKDKPKVIEDLAKKGNKTAKKVRKATDKIIKAGKGKDLTSSEFYDAVSEELGLPKVSPEVSTKILDLATKVSTAPEGIPKDRATLELTKYIATQKGFKASDLPLGIYYGNILSGYNTHLVNAIDTLGNVNSEIFGLALINPRAAAKIYGSLLRGFSEGKADALMALTEGRIATDEKWMDVPKLMEVAQFGTKGGVPIDTSTKGGQIAKMLGESKLATPLNLYKYVGRALAASDAFNFRGVKEAKAAQLAYQIATSEGKKGQELTDRMDEILGLDKMSGLLAQAKSEGFEGTQATARAIELREQLRDSGIVDASSDFAGEATYNHKPHGSLGIIANGIESVSNKLLPLKLFVPFTRIVANVTNRSLNYTPYGYKRAFMGYTGEDAPIGDAKAMALARANIGTTALGVLAVLAAQGLIEINGAGPSDDEKRKQLMSAGWKPYSIRIGDNYINYLLTPVGLGLSVIGNMIDSQKYNELGNKDAATRAVYALGRIGSTVASQSFISGLSSLFRILSEAPGEAVGAIKSTISGTTSGFTTPTLLRDINRLFNNKLYQSNSIAGDFIKNTPFAGLALKPALNALGEPVTLPRQRFYTSLKEDAAWRVLVDKGLRVPVPSKATAATPEEPGALSSTQYYHYLQESGQELKKFIEKNESRLRKLDSEKGQELLKKEAEKIHKRILPRIRREKYLNP